MSNRILLLHDGERPTQRFRGKAGMLAYFLDRNLIAASAGGKLRRGMVEPVYGRVARELMTKRESMAYYQGVQYPKAGAALAIGPVFKARTFPDGQCPLLDAVRRSVDGCVAVIADTPDEKGPEDLLFDQSYNPRFGLTWAGSHVGVAANGRILTPKKFKDKFVILVDHCRSPYQPSGQDYSEQVLGELIEWRRRNEGILYCDPLSNDWREIEIRRITSAGIEIVEDEYAIDTWHEIAGMPWMELAQQFNEANVFWLTHGKTVHHAAIEAAMAGALIVAPAPAVNSLWNLNIDLVQYNGEPPWREIVAGAKPEQCREKAEELDRWIDLASIILDGLYQWTPAPGPTNSAA